MNGTVTGWVVTGNVTSSPAGATNGTHSAALSDGTDSQGDTLSQTFSTLTGRVYAADFDAGIFGVHANGALQVQVQVIGSGGGTLLNQTITPPEAGTFDQSAVIFQHYRFTFTANSTNATLRFTSVGLGNGAADQVIDSVTVTQLTQTPTPTPTPTATPIPTPTPTPTATPGPPPTLRISAGSTLVNRGASTTVTVTASSVQVVPLTVRCSTAGTAVQGVDYTLSGNPGQIVIPEGQTSATFQLNALTNANMVNAKAANRAKTAKFILMTDAKYKLPRRAGKSVTIKIR